ncbi:hypothetical protein FKW77_000255 [Venturia effusa]|uniref:Uncharacterized protein n=1 Tax=Venturia effusa TaxID=50376 RepID=A0A517LJL4_9PEZI|nr:hypothetical protein FKW77_000255 [Venturia effusa]
MVNNPRNRYLTPISSSLRFSCNSIASCTIGSIAPVSYFQPFEISTTPADGVRVQQSSSDPLLTALASLGAHRLKAKRGLITLSTKDTEFVLAEAGTGLSPQQDDDEKDPLWHGTGPLPVNIGLGTHLCKLFCTTGEDSLVVDDLTQHETYRDNSRVKEGPML